MGVLGCIYVTPLVCKLAAYKVPKLVALLKYRNPTVFTEVTCRSSEVKSVCKIPQNFIHSCPANFTDNFCWTTKVLWCQKRSKSENLYFDSKYFLVQLMVITMMLFDTKMSEQYRLYLTLVARNDPRISLLVSDERRTLVRKKRAGKVKVGQRFEAY